MGFLPQWLRQLFRRAVVLGDFINHPQFITYDSAHDRGQYRFVEVDSDLQSIEPLILGCGSDVPLSKPAGNTQGSHV